MESGRREAVPKEDDIHFGKREAKASEFGIAVKGIEGKAGPREKEKLNQCSFSEKKNRLL